MQEENKIEDSIVFDEEADKMDIQEFYQKYGYDMFIKYCLYKATQKWGNAEIDASDK